VTAAIAWAAKRGNVLPGVLPLFPIFTIFSLLAIGAKGNVEGFHETATAAAKTIRSILAFSAPRIFLPTRWITGSRSSSAYVRGSSRCG
jgi:uncharacterized membrane protein (GlpM family)